MTLRLFAAIPIPDEIADRLEPLQRDVHGASWRPRENFHITLRFFGEINEAVARDLDLELARIAEHPFEIRLKGMGSFGGREPTALWAGVEAPEALARLSAGCERAARRVGLAQEKKNFTPHVTLAYCHGTTDHDAAAFQERVGAFATDLFWVDHFVLFSSVQTRRASAYVEEAVYPLNGTGS
jgi:2'-5' RNA ligase